jgi:glycosyltransferase involved in cell wall biosynthesis
MTTVIIPAYNEAKNIHFILGIPKKYNVLVVDDGSTDSTSDVVRKVGFPCIRLKKNMGKGYACRFGVEHTKDDKIILMDGDAQFFPEDIASLEKALDRCDLVIGQRLSYSSPLRQISNKLTAKLLNIGLDDVLCGFRAIRRSDFLSLKLTRNRYEIESEMLLNAKKIGLKVVGIPVKVQEGDSKMRFRDILRTTWFILSRKSGLRKD